MQKLFVEFTDPQVGTYEMGYATDGAAGIDLHAAEGPSSEQDWFIARGGSTIINCGIKVIIPEGCEGNVRLRSGHAFKQDLMCHNGTIDSDYRGELHVKVWNLGPRPVRIKHGERFAQLVIHPVERVEIEVIADVTAVSSTTRGAKGYGSTGKRSKAA